MGLGQPLALLVLLTSAPGVWLLSLPPQLGCHLVSSGCGGGSNACLPGPRCTRVGVLCRPQSHTVIPTLSLPAPRPRLLGCHSRISAARPACGPHITQQAGRRTEACLILESGCPTQCRVLWRIRVFGSQGSQWAGSRGRAARMQLHAPRDTTQRSFLLVEAGD